MNDDAFKSILNLCNDPFFRRQMAEFFVKSQQEGIEAAKLFWETSPKKDVSSSAAADIMEQMAAFYSQFGFVPGGKYQEALKENKILREENEFLKNAIRELKHKLFVEGGAKVQEAWRETVEEQMKLGAEMAKNFFDLFDAGRAKKK